MISDKQEVFSLQKQSPSKYQKTNKSQIKNKQQGNKNLPIQNQNRMMNLS